MLSSKLQLLKGLAAASFVFSFCLLISTFVACGVCYTEPCYEGDGVATLWSVNRALGFQAVTDAFVSCAWVAGVLWFLLRSRDEGKLTLLLGGGGLVVLLSLQTAALFGSESLTMTQLQTHYAAAVPIAGTILEQNAACLAKVTVLPSDANWAVLAQSQCQLGGGCLFNPMAATPNPLTPAVGVVGQCQLSLTLNDGARATFDAVAAFAAINFLLQAGMLFLLRFGGLDGESLPGMGSSSSYADIAPPVSQGGFSQGGGGVTTGFEGSSGGGGGGGGANDQVASQYRDL